MKRRNTNTFRAKFTGLRTHAFGIAQTINWTPEIVIYQARVSPELWRARPLMKHGNHIWEAAAAAQLMDLITSDFVGTIKPWTEWTDTNVCIGLVSRGGADREDERHAS